MGVYVLTQFVLFFLIVLTISHGISAYFAYKYMNRNKKNDPKKSFNYQTSLPY